MSECPECDHLRDVMDERDRRYEQEHAAIRKSMDAALVAMKEAVIKAEAAAERRFESINEFRGQLADQAGTFVGRNEYLAQHAALAEKLDTETLRIGGTITELTRRMDRTSGSSAGKNAMYGWIIAGVGMLATIMTVIIIATR